MQGAVAIANFFISKSKEPDGGEITPMKLLKLVYIAHGWHLGLYDEPLISEAVEAWKLGPVVRSVYRAFRDYGSGEVTEPCGSRTPDPALYDFLNRIWDVYKNYSGLALSALTHQKDTPWEIVTREYKGKNLPLGLIIPTPIIRSYYKGMSENAGA